MAYCIAVCQCSFTYWKYRSKKEFDEINRKHQLEGSSVYCKPIKKGFYKYQRISNCGNCGTPLLVSGLVYNDKQLIAFAKGEIGRQLLKEYQGVFFE